MAHWFERPKYQRNTRAMRCFGVALGTFRFLWIGFLKITPRLFPHARHRLPEYIFFKLADYARRDLFERFVIAINFIELGRALRKEQAALEHLHFDAELEHIARWRHCHVGDARRGQQMFSFFAEAALTSALIDGASQYISGAQSKGRTHRAGSTDAASRADSGRSRELVLILQLVAQGENRRKQRRQGTVVGMAPRIRFHSEVFRNGHAPGQAQLPRA